MIRFVGRHSCGVVFALAVLLSAAVLLADESAPAQPTPKEGRESKTAAEDSRSGEEPQGQKSNDEKSKGDEVRSFQPVETDPDPIPGLRLPVDMRTGESPFLSNGVQRQIALWILLGFAVVLLLNLILWRKAPETEVVETAPPVDAPSYEEVLAAAAERERIKQATQRQ